MAHGPELASMNTTYW